MGKKTKKLTTANAYLSLYEGQYDLGFECVGASKCAHARFYVEPPEPDDECSCQANGACNNMQARKASLELMSRVITANLAEMEG